MNDYEQFMGFFTRMGVPFATPDHPDGKDATFHRHGEEPEESVFTLSVSQAIFCFDKNKAYIGVVSDEMGVFEPRGS